jgi:hypothetical protein
MLLGTSVPAAATSDDNMEQTCWLNTDNDEFSCFDTFEDFVAASGVASGNRASLDADVEPYAAYTLAILYENASYGGASYYLTTSNSSLCSGVHYYGSSMPSGWNDRASSFTAYGTCRVKLWADTGYAGSSYGPSAGTSTLGSMNDEASSYQIYVP